MKVLKGISTGFATVVLALTVGITGVSAQTVMLKDNFTSFTALSPEEGGKWWVLNVGLNEGNYHVYNDFCGDGTCVLPKSNEGKYVSLELYPSAVEGNYYNAEITELHTGFSSNQPTKWNPEVGKPVVIESKVRWSDNFNADGTGGATGSSGIWLWNSPIDYVFGEFNPHDGIGFNWAPSTSPLAPGLNIGTLIDNWPVSQTPADIDMQEWNVFRSVWGVDAEGNQYVDSYVNGVLVNHYDLYTPLSDLSVEIWHDNQRVTPDFDVALDSPQETQEFHIDWIKVKK